MAQTELEGQWNQIIAPSNNVIIPLNSIHPDAPSSLSRKYEIISSTPPLYDVASILPYPDINFEKAKVSMKIGGEYRLRNIRPYHWRKLAVELRLDPEKTLRRVSDFAAQLADHVTDVQKEMMKEGLKHPIISQLADSVIKRAVASRKLIQRG